MTRPIGRPFQKGQSGNPKGRPRKDLCPSDIIRKTDKFRVPDSLAAKFREQFPELENEPITLHLARILRAQMKAANGSIRHAEWLETRGYGSVPTTIEMEHREGAVDFDELAVLLTGQTGDTGHAAEEK